MCANSSLSLVEKLAKLIKIIAFTPQLFYVLHYASSSHNKLNKALSKVKSQTGSINDKNDNGGGNNEKLQKLEMMRRSILFVCFGRLGNIIGLYLQTVTKLQLLSPWFYILVIGVLVDAFPLICSVAQVLIVILYALLMMCE